MLSKKRPLRELSQAPQTPRYAPSTPHAIRALQQRSGAGQRSARLSHFRADAQRPDSARGILRRLAKITAPVTKKRISTPSGKENVQSGSSGRNAVELGEGDDGVDERPEFSLPVFEGNGWEDEVESDLGDAPTSSVLPSGDYDPIIPYQTVPVRSQASQPISERPSRRLTRTSSVPRDDEDDDDRREVEIGRRAVSEGPMDRYPRSSFGSIRMSGFGLDHQARFSFNAEGNQTGIGADDDYDIGFGFGEDQEQDLDNETEDFRRHRRSPSVPNELNFDEDAIIEDSTFRLEMPLELVPDPDPDHMHSKMAPSDKVVSKGRKDSERVDMERDSESLSAGPNSPQQTRRLTPMEAATARRPRRKRVKLTRHGIEIPTLPSSLIRRVAIESMTQRGKRKPAIGTASLQALEQATEWFFEQVGEDLVAYSKHAGRTKKIDATDVLTLMRRQRVLQGDGKLGDFAIEHLPPEALFELDLPDTL